MDSNLRTLLLILVLLSGCIYRNDGTKAWTPTTTSTVSPQTTQTTIKTTSTTKSTTTSTTTSTMSFEFNFTAHAVDTTITTTTIKRYTKSGKQITADQINDLLNLRPHQGSSGYQSGFFDCRDEIAELLEIKERPKFRSRPSSGLPTWYSRPPDITDDLACFRLDSGGGITINRTRLNQTGLREWNWNDDRCKSSTIRFYKP